MEGVIFNPDIDLVGKPAVFYAGVDMYTIGCMVPTIAIAVCIQIAIRCFNKIQPTVSLLKMYNELSYIYQHQKTRINCLKLIIL